MVILRCVLYQMLTDKNKQYRSRLEHEDNTKRHQLKILQKTHRTQQEEKQELIENLEALIEDLEEKVAQCEANGELYHSSYLLRPLVFLEHRATFLQCVLSWGILSTCFPALCV